MTQIASLLAVATVFIDLCRGVARILEKGG